MIRLERVSKRYTINSGQMSLRQALGTIPSRLLGRRRAEPESQVHWALRDVSFEVPRGEAVAVVGRNGAGKTTTLKLLSRITRPTSGTLSVDGRVSALIELGAGFHPDLTGRENVFLNGTILGLTRREIGARLDKIVAFAELERFIDTPVKRYSSGMYARLGFAVAAHTDPDVLLVDEVLAVGDGPFQQKCYDFIHRFVTGGKTTLFVSHNLYAAEQLCQRAVWLQGGRVRAFGPSSEVVATYLDELEADAVQTSEQEIEQGAKLTIAGLSVRDASGQPRDTFLAGEDVVVDIAYHASEPLVRPKFCLWVSSTSSPDPLFAANMILDGEGPELIEGHGTLRCTFRHVPLQPRAFYVWLEAWGGDGAELLFKWQRLAAFRVVDPALLASTGSQRGAARFAKDHAPVAVSYEWDFGRKSKPATIASCLTGQASEITAAAVGRQ